MYLYFVFILRKNCDTRNKTKQDTRNKTKQMEDVAKSDDVHQCVNSI